MFKALRGLQSRREQLFRSTPEGVLKEFYAVPFPAQTTPVDEVTYAVLDFETTGLDLQHDHILSMGMVEIQGLGVCLDSAWHTLVSTDRKLPEDTTIIHGITDDAAGQGDAIEHAMAALLSRLAGKVLIAHYATIELGLLSRACQSLYGQEFLMPVIDTQRLAHRQLSRERALIKEGDLRLFNLRRRYHLPEYPPHHALYDALATAELFLALLAELYPARDCVLKDLLDN